LITGANTLNDAFRSILNKMADALLNIGLFGNVAGTLTGGGGLLGKLFSGFLANGGSAKAGKSYIVGEKGPELFTPGTTGTVTPNHALGGSTNVVVNVDASGSSVEGDVQQSEQLGRAISDAIQSELVKQQRPGGLLYR
jgi:phage-related minor tail protein